MKTIYTTKDINFMKEHYKGGGHPGAAGCTITQEQFIKILKKKEL